MEDGKIDADADVVDANKCVTTLSFRRGRRISSPLRHPSSSPSRSLPHLLIYTIYGHCRFHGGEISRHAILLSTRPPLRPHRPTQDRLALVPFE